MLAVREAEVEYSTVLYCRSCDGMRPPSHVYCFVCADELRETRTPRRVTPPAICLGCGERLPVTAAVNARYCAGCRRLRASEGARRWFWEHKHGCAPPPRPRLCAQCGAPMPQGINGHALYCCDNCKRLAYNARQAAYQRRKRAGTLKEPARV